MSATIQSWIGSSLIRNFPSTSPGGNRPLRLDVARNERFSFQVGFRHSCASGQPLTEPVRVSVEISPPVFWAIRVRRVGYVPVRHRSHLAAMEETDGFHQLPGFVPDPLFDETEILLPPEETHSFWISVRARGRGAPPGLHGLTVVCRVGKRILRSHKVSIRVADLLVGKRKDFRVTQWFYCDALLEYYRLQPFEERFWELLERYLKNLADHGQDTIYVPLLTPSLDGFKRPTQLLHVARRGKSWQFNWEAVKRFVDTARRVGLTHFEWPHLFTQWGCARAIAVYRGHGETEEPLWRREEPALSPVYRRFLGKLLPELHEFLRAEKLLKRSFFHLSDEPRREHLENYRAARAMIREIAPWIKVMDALSDIQFAREGVTDLPVAAVNHIMPFLEEKLACWAYYCCSQRGPYLNRLLDTPLSKIRMNGWLFHRWPLGGFLHWGANYWFMRGSRNLADPYHIQDAGAWPDWPYGDPFIVYPGPHGPVDSIRWEVLGESLQDMALLQTLGIEGDNPLLAPLKNFADFPKSEKWLLDTRRRLLRSAPVKRQSGLRTRRGTKDEPQMATEAHS